ncbi:hypothetical protein QTJ16_001080 [Diplocarpon rosae]|uniref:Uncharacterized protein n=1 Tax=Diplocarpon rosae TaxID=946125 RepID=A0AAD9T839_9HELO|nr:hypothetical protein QTJ16_001080 [Diplocarpon rosae]
MYISKLPRALSSMSLNMVEPSPEFDDSTVNGGVVTPPETVIDLPESNCPPAAVKDSSSVPWPGSTFIIRSASSGQVLTLDEGQLKLASPGGRGSIYWACVQGKGWLGFRNTVSGRYLGHCVEGRLRCAAGKQQGWENFCVRLTPEGGYVLLMTHHERLWYVGSIQHQGREKLAKVSERIQDAIVWEFVKV